VSGWSNQAADLIILEEQATGYSGLFGYSPAPAQGNLVLSSAAAAGTDPYGNAYLAGFTTYGKSGGTHFACQNSAAGQQFYTAPSAAGPWTEQAFIVADSAEDLLLTAAGQISFTTGSPTQPTQVQIRANSGLWVTGEAWNPVTGDNGFTTSALAYQAAPLMSGAVAFRGQVTTPASGNPNGVTAFQLPSPTYIPAAARRWPVVNVNAADVTGYAVLDVTGEVHFEGLPAGYNSSQVELNGLVWL
jgi:hypothetical protein